MKKVFKILGGVFVIGTIVLAIIYFKNNETLPTGKQGKAADTLANKMLTALNVDAYNNTHYIEWSFRGKHFYKWDKQANIVEVSWENTRVILYTKEPKKSKVYKNNSIVNNPEVLQKAIDYFNNDSFWLVAPYKVFEEGIERRLVNYNNKEALLVTYTTGGSTPGDSYLWILDDSGKPIKYKMWVSIIPTGGLEASWSDWIVTESGALLPTKHKMAIGILDMGDVRGYN